MKRKNYIIIIVLIFLVSLFSFIALKKSFNNTIISSKKISFERKTYRDKTNKYDLLKVPVETHGGMVTDTLTGLIINSDDTYKVENDIIKNTIVYSQNWDTDREYKIIVLKDYKQINFYVNDVEYNSYSFVLHKEDNIVVPIEIKNSENDIFGEIGYMIVQEPNYNQMTENNENIEEIMFLDSLSRYFFFKVKVFDYNEIDQIQKKIANKEDWHYTNKEDVPIQEISLIKDMTIEPKEKRINYTYPEMYFKLAIEIKSNNQYDIFINNPKETKMGYFVFQTIDWKQVPFEDGDFVKYFELDQKSVGQYKFNVPKVKEDSVYSVLTFPSSEYYKNINQISSSKRAIIKP